MREKTGEGESRSISFIIYYTFFYLLVVLECLYEGTELGPRNAWVL